MIYILNITSEPNIKSTLDKWSRNRNDIGGFLSVTILDHLTLKHLSTSAYFQFQVDETYRGETTTFNEYIFSKHAFQQAFEWFKKDMTKPRLRYYFVDEVGSLEIDDLGHDPLVKHIVQQDNSEHVFILFVREPYIQQIQEKYQLQENRVISLKQVIG